MKKRGLGRNLDVLLSRTRTTPLTPVPTSPETTAPTATENNNGEQLSKLPLQSLQAGRYQPRKDFAPEALQELADSIRTQGVIQPIVVRKINNERYEIIAGERRFRAAQLAGLTEIPAVIKDIPDEAALAISLIENIQRENLNPLEEATALQRLGDEFGLTHQEIAGAVGKSRAAVTNLLRLLTLQPDVKLLIENGDIEMGHARALLALNDLAQSQAARTVVTRGLSVRETEDLVRKWQGDAANSYRLPKKADPNITRLQQQLSEHLGAAVVCKHNNKGKGKLIVHYSNLMQLEGILERMKTAETVEN